MCDENVCSLMLNRLSIHQPELWTCGQSLVWRRVSSCCQLSPSGARLRFPRRWARSRCRLRCDERRARRPRRSSVPCASTPRCPPTGVSPNGASPRRVRLLPLQWPPGGAPLSARPRDRQRGSPIAGNADVRTAAALPIRCPTRRGSSDRSRTLQDRSPEHSLENSRFSADRHRPRAIRVFQNNFKLNELNEVGRILVDYYQKQIKRDLNSRNYILSQGGWTNRYYRKNNGITFKIFITL